VGIQIPYYLIVVFFVSYSIHFEKAASPVSLFLSFNMLKIPIPVFRIYQRLVISKILIRNFNI